MVYFGSCRIHPSTLLAQDSGMIEAAWGKGLLPFRSSSFLLLRPKAFGISY